jgi:hypothetical protein
MPFIYLLLHFEVECAETVAPAISRSHCLL